MAADLLSAFVGTERFELRRPLGSGTHGAVYEAFDRRRGAAVALKLLGRIDPAALLRFKNEFRSLTSLAHPNLVAVHELHSEEDVWFFTMELVDGCDFLTHVRGAPAFPREQTASLEGGEEPAMSAAAPLPAGRLDPERLVRALWQLALALGALHEARTLHCDLKPSNVLVAREDARVVVLDFGLAAPFERVAGTRGRPLAGTPAYMAPEQGAGQPLDAAADWYAVGAMLFEALTGRLPFSGSPAQMVRDKQLFDAPSPARSAPDVPADLAALCLELLRREPQARLQGAAALRRIESLLPEGAGRALRIAGGEEPPRLIGREKHLRYLEDAYERSREGTAVPVRVYGRSGMGKTALCERFLAELAARAQPVILRGRCYSGESLPYKAFDGIVDALAEHLTGLGAEAAALVPPGAALLARMFPVLQGVPAVAGAAVAAPAPTGTELRERAFGLLRELFRNAARRRPIVLFIDDLQWADADSALLLADLLHPDAAPPLLLLACTRSDDADSPEAQASFEDLPVDPLDGLDAAELAAALLGPIADARRVARAIARQSGGSPLLIREIARHVREEPAESDLSFDRILVSSLDALPASAQRLLETVAVAGRPLPEPWALRAAEAMAVDQSALRAAGFVRSANAGEIEVMHDRIRETVLRRLSAPARALRHLAIAKVMEASGTADPEMLALHLREGGELDHAGAYARAAAARAAEALAFDRSARLYRMALELHTLSPVDEARLRERLGDALMSSGRTAEAAREYVRAASSAPLRGRERELAVLERLAAELRRGRGGWVALEGPAGVGKSRLVRALLQRLGEGTPAPRVLAGQPLPYGRGIPYYLWSRLLRPLVLEVGPGDLPAGDREVLDQLTSGRYRPAAEAKRQRHLLGGAMIRLVEVAARRAPRVLLLEDLHWSDPTSLDVAAAVLEMADRLPLLLVFGMRPEGALALRLRLARFAAAGEWIAVPPLGDAACRELLADLAGDALDAARRSEILADAGGVPSLVEERVRSLVEQGALRRVDGTWRFDAARASAAAGWGRFDRFAPGDRGRLEMASVIGREIAPELVDRLLGIPHDPACWARLEAAGVLASTLDPETSELRFRLADVRTQEALYGSLSRERREALHLSFAEWLDADDALAGAYLHSRAWHFERAGKLEKAASYWAAAARLAIALDANAEALELYRNAEAISADGRLRIGRAELLLEMGRLAEAAQVQEEVIRAAAAAGEAALEAEAQARRAYLAYRTGDGPGILAHAERALACARAAGDRRLAAQALRQVGVAHEFAGRFAPAREAYEELLAVLGAEDHDLQARVYNSLGEIARASFAPEEAISWYEKAHEAWGRDHPGAVQPTFLLNSGAAYVALGRYEYGLALLDQTIAEKRRAGLLGFLSEAYYYRGMAHLGLGEGARAAEDAVEAMHLAGKSGEREMIGVALRLRALTAASAAEAEAALRESVTVLAEIGKTGEEARSRSELGKLFLAQGREQEAALELRRAAELFTALGIREPPRC